MCQIEAQLYAMQRKVLEGFEAGRKEMRRTAEAAGESLIIVSGIARGGEGLEHRSSAAR